MLSVVDGEDDLSDKFSEAWVSYDCSAVDVVVFMCSYFDSMAAFFAIRILALSISIVWVYVQVNNVDKIAVFYFS